MITTLANKVKSTIQNNSLIEKHDHIVVGISGGPDSVCLLSVLNDLSREWRLTLYGVHVNHMLRGKDADEDQRYTVRLCEKLKIPCYTFSYDVEALGKELGVTTEEAGRQVRYDSFEDIKNRIESKMGGTEKIAPRVKIAVAHNMNDQAETLLMRIIRGTGPEGLAGMEYIRDGIVRPLLDITREEIEVYCREKDLNPRIDFSNLEPLYTRNRLRLQLLPLLEKEYNANILEVLNRLAKIAREDREYFNSRLAEMSHLTIFNDDFSKGKIIREKYLILHPAIGKRIIASSLKKIGMQQDITALHLNWADELMRNGKTGDRIDLPRKYTVEINYEHGELYKQDAETKQVEPENHMFAHSLVLDKNVHIPELNSMIKAEIFRVGISCSNMKKVSVSNNFSVCLDLSNLKTKDSIQIRNRRPGDYITPLGMKGRKKLQDFFVDEKISKSDRDSIPLVCVGDEVIWIVGHRINEKYKITENTTKAVYLEYLKLT